jgi:hypothetical protein
MDPSFLTPIAEPPASRPALLLVVDTEEEFDWSAPFARENVGVTAATEIGRLQRIAESFALKPTYVVDFPIAATPRSASIFAEIAARGACQIGAHLHPWVTPPFEEPLVPAMSFGCNLGSSLERAKIGALTESIVTGMGVVPMIYKAGRYGFGPTTAQALEALDYRVDTSVIPHLDFSPERGPSFSGFQPGPATFGRTRTLLELPCTTGFIGAARKAGEPLHRAASSPWLRPVRAVGALGRLGVLNRVMLSPEGNSLDELCALTRALHGDGLRTFVLTLHSPSLKPGCTPYVRTAADRDAMLDTIARYCEFFFSRIEGEPGTPDERYARFASASVSSDSEHTHEP